MSWLHRRRFRCSGHICMPYTQSSLTGKLFLSLSVQINHEECTQKKIDIFRNIRIYSFRAFNWMLTPLGFCLVDHDLTVSLLIQSPLTVKEIMFVRQAKMFGHDHRRWSSKKDKFATNALEYQLYAKLFWNIFLFILIMISTYKQSNLEVNRKWVGRRLCKIKSYR